MDGEKGGDGALGDAAGSEEGGEFAGRADEGDGVVVGVESVDQGGEGAAAGSAEEEDCRLRGCGHGWMYRDCTNSLGLYDELCGWWSCG